MKFKFLTILLILSFGAFSVLGFVGLSMVNHSEQHNCPTPLVSGGDCPTVGNNLALISHHLSGLSQFTQLIINTSMGTSFLVLLIVLSISFFWNVPRLLLEDFLNTLIYQRHRLAKSRLIIPTRNILRWFILHNKLYPLSTI